MDSSRLIRNGLLLGIRILTVLGVFLAVCGHQVLAVVFGKNKFRIWIIILLDGPYRYVLLRTFGTLVDIDYVGHMLNRPLFSDPMICQVITKYHNHAI
jgi:hypothetical protein